MKPAAERVTKWLLITKWLRLQNGGWGSSYHSPVFCLLKREKGEEKGRVLGHSFGPWLLPASGEGHSMFSSGVLRAQCLDGAIVVVPPVAPEGLVSLEEKLIESLIGGSRYAI
jgi:hypothetical protein